MNLTLLSVSDFKKIERLIRKKEILNRQVGHIDAQLAGMGGKPAALKATAVPSAGRKAAKRRRSPARRTELKSKLIEALKAAGKPGIAIKDVAARLKLKEPNVRVWFYTTGKRIKEIKKVGPSRFAWNG